MIVEIKLKRDNGDLIFEFTANACSRIVQPFYEPLIFEDDHSLALLSFKYEPEIGKQRSSS